MFYYLLLGRRETTIDNRYITTTFFSTEQYITEETFDNNITTERTFQINMKAEIKKNNTQQICQISSAGTIYFVHPYIC